MRKTKYIIFVDKGELDDPGTLFDATMVHLIKKECPVTTRKLFKAQYMKQGDHKSQMAVINEWVQVRDVTTFPFRHSIDVAVASDSLREVTDTLTASQEKEMSKAGLRGAAAGRKLRKEANEDWKQQNESTDTGTGTMGEKELNAMCATLLERNTDEDKGVEGSVPVDDGADKQSESRATPD